MEVRPAKCPTKAAGVTLIELVVAIAVLAILLTLAVPAFGEFFERSRLRSAVDDVQSLLANARAGAVQTGRNVRVSFGGTTNVWCVGARAAQNPATPGGLMPEAAACDCADAGGAACTVAGNRMVADGTGRPSVTVSTVAADFTFDNKSGVLTTLAPASVNFTSAPRNYVLQLNVSTLGHARICVPAGQKAFAGVSSC